MHGQHWQVDDVSSTTAWRDPSRNLCEFDVDLGYRPADDNQHTCELELLTDMIGTKVISLLWPQRTCAVSQLPTAC